MQTWGVPNGNLKHTVSTACRPGVFLSRAWKSQTYRQYSMQTWGVPNGNLKHTVSTACRPGVFLTEISNIPSVQHADLGVPNGNLLSTGKSQTYHQYSMRTWVFLTEISNIPSVQHADLGCS